LECAGPAALFRPLAFSRLTFKWELPYTSVNTVLRRRYRAGSLDLTKRRRAVALQG